MQSHMEPLNQPQNLTETPSEELLVAVLVDTDAPNLPQPFTYTVPASLAEQISVGSCVLVPFAGRKLLGFVTETNAPRPEGHQLHAIISLVNAEPFFDAPLCRLIFWIAHRWKCGAADSLRCVVPSIVTSQIQRSIILTGEAALAKLTQAQKTVVEKLKSSGGSITYQELQTIVHNPAQVLRSLKEKGLVSDQYILLPPRVRPKLRKALKLPENADANALIACAASEKQVSLLMELQNSGKPVLQSELIQKLGISDSVIRGVLKRGLAEACEIEVPRDPFPRPATPTPKYVLTEDQRRAIAPILASIGRGSPERFLLHGVTASGKTEVYLRAAEEVACQGGSSIILVPEISLTAQMLDAVKSRFGKSAAVLHSRLSDGERYDEWMRIRRGEAVVVIGPRSAVFAPVQNLRLIVVDEEHDSSYKQESTPRYHARDVAARRASLCGASLVLGSATPAVETFYWATKGHLKLLSMPRRIDDRPLPKVELVDMRQSTSPILSDRLRNAVAERLDRGQQVILFINRRGYSSFVLCRDCGYTARCPNCSVSLTYHASARKLQCHHCNYHTKPPTKCPSCSGTRIRYFGLGTERVEEEVRRLFPAARPLRMDSDTTTRKGSHHLMLKRFREREANILIGTQMIAKGLDFPGVTLVGVIAADIALNLPDFRASERCFQLMAQVSGRAGRGDDPGEVIVQTFNPEHYSLKAASAHDYLGFYQQEISFRRELLYPPFSTLANILSADIIPRAAEGRAKAAAKALKEAASAEGLAVQLLGPAPAPIERIKSRYRWHLLVKAPNHSTLSKVLQAIDRLPESIRTELTVDVDPMNLL